MTAEVLVLRLVHILGGVFWVGTGLFTTFFLMPAVVAAGPAAGPIMGGLQKRRLFAVLPAVALATILSGLRLIWIASDGFEADYFHTRTGLTYTVAALASIVAFALSLLVARPMAIRSTQITAQMAQAPDGEARATLARELAAVRSRGATAAAVGVTMLIVSAAGMAVARYL